MGKIRIDIMGSFKIKKMREFSALHGGHAQAVAEAIEWLSAEILPQAILQDHWLQSNGAFPENTFGLIPPLPPPAAAAGSGGSERET